MLIHQKGSNSRTSKLIGIKCGKIYKLNFHQARELIDCSGSDLCELWHRQLTHLHHGTLTIIREIVTGLPNFRVEKQDVCKGCALGKYSKTAFPINDNISIGILDLIHSKLCVLIRPYN